MYCLTLRATPSDNQSNLVVAAAAAAASASELAQSEVSIFHYVRFESNRKRPINTSGTFKFIVVTSCSCRSTRPNAGSSRS